MKIDELEKLLNQGEKMVRINEDGTVSVWTPEDHAAQVSELKATIERLTAENARLDLEVAALNERHDLPQGFDHLKAWRDECYKRDQTANVIDSDIVALIDRLAFALAENAELRKEVAHQTDMGMQASVMLSKASPQPEATKLAIEAFEKIRKAAYVIGPNPCLEIYDIALNAGNNLKATLKASDSQTPQPEATDAMQIYFVALRKIQASDNITNARIAQDALRAVNYNGKASSSGGEERINELEDALRDVLKAVGKTKGEDSISNLEEQLKFCEKVAKATLAARSKEGA